MSDYSTHVSKETLMPCPFCGGEASKRLFYGSKYGIYCDECSARVGGLYDTEAEAIAAWNARHQCGLTDEDYSILLDELGVSERTCHIEYPYYGDAPVINGQPRCSKCETEFAVGAFPNYCPECGAKVVVE